VCFALANLIINNR